MGIEAWTEAATSVWRGPDFCLVWIATFLNNTGDWVLRLALPAYVFVETGSGAATAALFVSELVLGALLGPVGGSVADRVNLKRLVVATNLAQALTLLPLLAVRPDRIWPAFLVMAVQSALTQVNDPANMALVPRVAQAEQLTQANAALGAANNLARLIGAPVGGLALAWFGLEAVVVLDMVSFVIAAAAMSRLRAGTDPLGSPGGAKAGVRDGLREARKTPPLLALIAVMTFSQLAQGGFIVLFVVFVVETLNDDGAILGIIRGAMAVGGLVGAAIIARIHTRVEPPPLLGWGLIGLGLVSVLFWNAPLVTKAPVVYVILFAASGIPASAIGAGVSTTMQLASPPEILGRVAGIMNAGATTGVAAGSILAGLLVDRVPLEYLINAGPVIEVFAGVLVLRFVRLKSEAAKIH